MTQDKSFSLRALTQHYSIQEVTTIFSDIDERIISMHDSSAKDFQMFNKQLRDFSEIARQINNNLQEIFDSTSDTTTEEEFKQFTHHFESLYENINSSYTALQRIKESSEHTLNYLQHIPLTLKNFNQDLLTLKFTLANIKVNFSGLLFEKDDDITRITTDVEELTQQIKGDLPELFKNARHTGDLLDELTSVISDDSFERINQSEAILKQINNSINELLAKNEEIGKALPEIQNYIQKSFTNLDKIITKIQYHDIIRQKMEHIQTTHQKLMDELSRLENNKENQIVLFKQAKYVSQLPYIAEIQIAQLVYTNKEYQNAIEAITQTFNEIKRYMSSSTDLTQKLSREHAYEVDNNYQNAKKELNNTAEVIYKLKKNYLDIVRIADTIVKRLSTLGAHLEDLKNLDSKLQQLSENLSNQIYNNLQDKSLAKIGMEIKNLANDLSSSIRNCELYHQYANRFGENIKEQLNLIKDREDINLAQKLCGHADKVLEKVISANQEAHKRLDENTRLSKTAHEKLKNTLDNMNYYDFFEGGMEAVIIELNNIYENLQYEHPDLSNLDKQEKLKRIKDFYTTRTERTVHDDVLSGQSQKDSPQEDEDDEDNIELF